MILLGLCLFYFGCDSNSQELRKIADVKIPKIDEFSSAHLLEMDSSSNFIVYSIYGDQIKYAFVRPNSDTISKLNVVKKVKGFRFLGFAGKYLILSKKNILQIIDLTSKEYYDFVADLPYGSFTKARAKVSNSKVSSFYSNYRTRGNIKRRDDCTYLEYAEFLTSTMKDDFIVEISIKNKKLHIDTLLTGLYSTEIFKGDSFGNSSLGCTDFEDSLCFYSYYDDKIYFINKKTKAINPFILKSDIESIKLDKVPFEMMKSDYDTFIKRISEDPMYFALIERVLYDQEKGLTYIGILHDEEVSGERSFSWLIYHKNRKICEKEFNSSFNLFSTFIHESKLYINKNIQDEKYFHYSVYDIGA